MKNSICAALLASATLLAASTAAHAQDDAEPKRNVFEGDSLTIGLGALYGPSYDGSDDGRISPLPAIRGRIGGVTINPRQGGVALDVIPDARGAKVGLAFGPAVGLSLNRARGIKDPVVAAAGKLDMAVELGANAGLRINRVLHDYDWVTISTDVKWDVAGAYGGMTVRPAVSYNTPLSKGVLLTTMAYAHHADDSYARYYYSVTPAQSSASGLPQFNAKGGWDKVGAGALVAWDLSGDLRDGGFAVLGLVAYSRMLGDGKTTPYTSLRGSPDQWLGGLGIAYTF